MPPASVTRGRRFAAALACMLVMSVSRTQPEREPEVWVIGMLRAVTSAQMTYAALCGRYARTLKELAAPSCEPRRVGSGSLLAPQVASGEERFGYRFEVVPGPEEAPHYAYIAVPLSAATPRTFCADDSGLIYITDDGARPLVRDGQWSIAGVRCSKLPCEVGRCAP